MGKDGYLYLGIVFLRFFYDSYFLIDEIFKVCLYYFKSFKWIFFFYDVYIVNNILIK